MSKNGSGTTQTQQVTQQTSVTVENIIQAQTLEPLQRVQLLADVFKTLDAQNAVAPQPQTVVISPPAAPSFFNNPNVIAGLIAASFALVVVAKKLR